MGKRDLIKLHKQLCAELGITPTKVYFGDLEIYCGSYFPADNSIWVDLNNCPVYGLDPREVIAHETYHHYQVMKGWLKHKVSWRGGSYWEQACKAYRKRPWEIGAHQYQGRIANREGWRDETKSKQKA